MGQGFLVPQGTFVNHKANYKNTVKFVNVPINFSAVIMTMVKSMSNPMEEHPHHKYSIEFYNSSNDHAAAWVYDDEDARDADYDRLLSTTFFG